jgi:DNA modification methylase
MNDNKNPHYKRDYPLKDLIPYARNSRTHSDEQVTQIASSIKEFGFTNPVLVDADGGIIAGHGRVMAAKKLGFDTVPVIELGYLTEAQKRAYIIADNKLALNAGWDDEMLRIEFDELADLGFDLELTGFSLDEISALQIDELTEGLTDEDAVPEAPETPVSVRGDVWLLGNHRLMCGDSTSIDDVEKLMAGHKADMVFTDPPYGVDYDGGHATEKRREKLANDDDVDMYDLPIKNAYLFSTEKAPIYLWFADRFAADVLDGLHSAGYQVRNWIIWNKNQAQFGAIGAQYKSKHEPCIYAFKKGKSPNWCGPNNEVTVWDVKRDNKNAFHPTQKPVELSERAFSNHSVGKVLDLFAGSGSTLISCEKNNKTCFTIDFEPKYVDVIIKRWMQFTGKQATLEATGQTYEELSNGRA